MRVYAPAHNYYKGYALATLALFQELPAQDLVEQVVWLKPTPRQAAPPLSPILYCATPFVLCRPAACAV